MNTTDQFASFSAIYAPEIAACTSTILAKMRKRYPRAIELVYDNYNALAIAFSSSERSSQAIHCVISKWVDLFSASKGIA
jgi:hypothetical protein